MTEPRRYQEDEVREIFGAAAEADDSGVPAVSSGAGMTLDELQAIGRQVGLPPERISEAALAIDRRGAALPRRTYLGMPISVGRTVDLPRAPTETEWERLVTELRETFHARGKVGSHGGLRDWTNGNLHAYVEPTETGHRLRLVTRKGDAVARTTVGVSLMAFGLLMLAVLILDSKLGKGFFIPILFGAMGGTFLGSTVFGLPRWAKEREEQMEYIATRAQALIGPEAEVEGEDH